MLALLNGTVAVVTTVPWVNVIVLLFALMDVVGTSMLYEFAARVVTAAAPLPTTLAFGDAGTVAVVTTVPCVNVIVLLLALIEAVGTSILYEFAARVVTAAAPLPTTLAFGDAGTVAVVTSVPFVKVIVLLLALIEAVGRVAVVTAVPCVIVIVLLLALTDVVGTLMLYEFAAKVVTAAAPLPTTLAFGDAGTVAVVTTVPCVNVIVLLLALIEAVGVVGTVAVVTTVPWVNVIVLLLALIEALGTSMLYEFAARVVTAAAPLPTTLALGIVTVLPPLLILKF